MEETYQELVAKLHAKLDEEDGGSPPEQQYWIGIAGGPGCGKSTVARTVVDRLNSAMSQEVAIVLPADGWHIPQSELIDSFGPDAMKRRGAPWTFDSKKCYHDLVQAKQDGHASLPFYDRDLSDPVPDSVHLYSTHQIVLVEGLYLLMKQDGSKKLGDHKDTNQDTREQDNRYWWSQVCDLFDERWFVKAPSRTEQIDRLVQRNKKTWSKDKDELWGPWPEGARKRAETNDVVQMDLIDPCERNADQVIFTV